MSVPININKRQVRKYIKKTINLIPLLDVIQ